MNHLWSGLKKGPRCAPQFLKDGTVMFQNDETVFALVDGVAEARWDLKWVHK